jgi:small multidrug resistance family-3 protein
VVLSLALFIAAAAAEIGGVYLVWRGLRADAGVTAIIAGTLLLTAYGVLATLQKDQHFGRVLAAYGGIFVAGSLLCGIVFDRFRPDRWDLTGAVICLVGAAIMMYTPRAAS